MNSKEALRIASHALATAKIDDALAEAEILLSRTLAASKTQLYAEPERILTLSETERLQRFIQRRLNREATAYILKSCEFYGIDFYVNHRVFIPRPETELLVEIALEFAHKYQLENRLTIVDIGTGSGNIAINLALSLPQAKIYATDISAPALQVARINCQRHKIESQVILLQGNLLEVLPEPADVIIANLPYVKDSEIGTLSPEITNFEPITALAGGKDGLDKIRQLLDQIPGKIRPNGCLLLEIGQGQSKTVSLLINHHFPQASVELISDLSGIERAVKVTF
jgi:release factor glutamine methyltransferase